MADPTTPVGRAGLVRRSWDAPLGAHVVALAMVLLALLVVVGTGASFSADEGAAIVQARSLSRGAGWIVEHPFAEVDPTGASYPLENSDHGPKGVAPYAKHPLYPLLLAGVDRLGGVTAMILLSLAGTLTAAVLAALLARRFAPTLARPTLWITALASPLLFDGFLVVAHTLAAALAVGAVLGALRAVERRSVGAAIATGICVVGGMLLRTEFVFLALGLAAACLGIAVLRRSWPALLSAATTLVGLFLAYAGEAWWVRSILGGRAAASGAASLPGGGIAGRLRGFRLTWLTSGYGNIQLVDLALYLVLGSVLLGAWTLRRRPAEHALIGRCALTAAGAATGALVLEPAHVVPGLLVAFPIAAAGLLLARRDTVRSPAATMATVTAGVFAAGVIATQYQRGGSGEWGGRYFALALPLVIPVILRALRDGGRHLHPRVWRQVVGGLVVCCLALSTMGVASLRAAHSRNAAVNRAVGRLAAGVPSSDPVVVAVDGAVARHGWPTFDRARWLLAPADVPALVARLRAAGEAEFLFVGRLPDDLARLGSGVEQIAEDHGGAAGRAWRVWVVRAS